MTTDWDRVRSMSDKEVEKEANEDLDCPLLTDEELALFKRVREEKNAD